MKLLFILLIPLIVLPNLLLLFKATTPALEVFPDTTLKVYTPQIIFQSKDFIQFFPDDTILTNVLQLKEFNRKTALNIAFSDFSRYNLWVRECFDDCHASYKYEVDINRQQKSYTLIETTLYGGCRGMGVNHFILKVPKPVKGYSVSKKFIRLDRDGTRLRD